MLDRILIVLRSMAWPGGEDRTGREAYQRAVESCLGEGKAFAFWKGRTAFYAILAALEVASGDEIIIPGYTCAALPAAILACGATPIYADIDPSFYNASPDCVEDRITDRTKAIVIQHTYGYPVAIGDFLDIAKEYDLPLIENCCHTFGGQVRDQLLGTFGAASFFSTQRSKPLSTGLGGLALIHEERLAAKVAAIQKTFPAPSRRSAFKLAAALLTSELSHSAVSDTNGSTGWLSPSDLQPAGTVGVNASRTVDPSYALKPAPVQCRLGRCEVNRVDLGIAHRQKIDERYRRELPQHGYPIALYPDDWEVIVHRYPIRVSNKEQVVHEAKRRGLDIGNWFLSPVHPITANLGAYGYKIGSCPVAEIAAKEVVNLPTHRGIGDSELDKILAFVKEVCQPVNAVPETIATYHE